MNRTSNLHRAWHTWVAFTAFPLVAGTAGPLSTALNICALVEPWRIDARGIGRTEEKFVDDPQWALAINGVSLGLGLAANFSLFCLVSGELLEKLKGMPSLLLRWLTKLLSNHRRLLLTTTITGYLASFLLVALAIAATKHFDKPPGVGWSQAYFFAIFSAGLYFLISCFMLFSALETKHQRIEGEGRHSAPSSLAQLRPLDLTHTVEGSQSQTIYHDGITTVDRMYHGQAEWNEHFENKKTTSQDGHMELHQELECYDSKIDAGSWKFTLDTRHHWLMFYSVLFLIYIQLVAKLYSSIEGWRYLDSLYWAIVTALTIGFGDMKPTSSTGRGLFCLVAPIGIILLAIAAYHVGKIVLEEARSTMEENIKSQKRQQERSRAHHEHHNIDDERGDQYVKMRKIEHLARFRCQAITFFVSLTIWVFLWLAGAFFFHLCEREQDLQNQGYPQEVGQPPHWTYVESLYMAQAALLTIGYGDFSPQSEAGRSFFVLWSLLAVPTTTALVASTVDGLTEQMGYKKRKQIEQKDGKRFLNQSHPYKLNENHGQNEKKPMLPTNHGSYDKTHIAAMLLKDVIYDHFSDAKYMYDFNSWEWFLYVLGAIDEPPHEEPDHIQEIHDEWNPQRPWDWLGDDNAISSREPEIQWILQKLVNKLVQELLNFRKENSQVLGRDGPRRQDGVY